MKLAFLVGAVFLAQTAYAVPVPWINCGAAGDPLSVSATVADHWPPGRGGPPFPVWSVAELNPRTGALKELRVGLIGPNWVFELEHPEEDIQACDGFVALPKSWAVHGSPRMRVTTDEFAGLPSVVPWRTSYPAPAGPLFFGLGNPLPPLAAGGQPNTYVFRGNLAQAKTPIARVSLEFEGKSGFPTDPAAVGDSHVRLQVTSPSGQGIFCIDQTIPGSAIVGVIPSR